MKIARPPRIAHRTEFNLTKQSMVYDMVIDGDRDTNIDYPPCVSQEHHDPGYVQAVRRCLTENGFGNRDYDVLLHAEQSSAAMVAAMFMAVDGAVDGVKCAFAPVSGFHHACYASAQGFCTFNGLIGTAMEYLHRHPDGRVLILDGDGHYGNGTQDLIDEHRLGKQVKQWHIARDNGTGWHEQLPRALKSVDLVLYQAGADAHIDDSYQAGTLNTGEFMYRDRLIFRACKEADVPIVWNLAGGYDGATTLDLHTSTFDAAVATFYPGQVRRPVKRGAEVMGLSLPDTGLAGS